MRTIDYCGTCDLCAHQPEGVRDFLEAACRVADHIGRHEQHEEGATALKCFGEAIDEALNTLWQRTTQKASA